MSVKYYLYNNQLYKRIDKSYYQYTVSEYGVWWKPSDNINRVQAEKLNKRKVKEAKKKYIMMRELLR